MCKVTFSIYIQIILRKKPRGGGGRVWNNALPGAIVTVHLKVVIRLFLACFPYFEKNKKV
jgi:hypothetical protein